MASSALVTPMSSAPSASQPSLLTNVSTVGATGSQLSLPNGASFVHLSSQKSLMEARLLTLSADRPRNCLHGIRDRSIQSRLFFWTTKTSSDLCAETKAFEDGSNSSYVPSSSWPSGAQWPLTWTHPSLRKRKSPSAKTENMPHCMASSYI
jgi:hypothetical protein